MNTELAQSLYEKIRGAYASMLRISGQLETNIIDSANRAREAGIYLEELNEQTPHGEWLKLFATAQGKPNTTPVFDFDAITARRLIRLYQAFPQPITELPDGVRCLKDLLIASKIVSPSTRTLLQNRHEAETLFDLLTHWTSKFDMAWKKRSEVEDPSQWPNAVKEQARAQLEPLVKLYERLQ